MYTEVRGNVYWKVCVWGGGRVRTVGTPWGETKAEPDVHMSSQCQSDPPVDG